MTPQTHALPAGWASAKLESIATSISTAGKKVRTQDALPEGRYPVIDQGAADCSGYLNDEASLVHASPEVPVILFGDHTRVVKFIERPFVPGADGTKLLQPKPGVWPRYFHYLLNAVEVPDRGYGRHFGYLRSVDLPVAPVLEQQRIADKLDIVLTRVDAVNTRLARVAPILKRFRQSVLSAATSGLLTGDGQAVESTLVPLASVSDVVDPNPKHRNPKYQSDGELFLSTTNFANPDGWDLATAKRVSIETVLDQQDRCHFTKDSLVFSRKGTIGKVRLVPNVDSFALLDSLVVINARKGLCPKYLLIALRAPVVQEQVVRLTRGVALKQVSVGVVRSLNIPLPGALEQTEIVRRVETLFAFADRLEARLKAAQTAADRLTPALLAKAFRGELVPQDPNDEPASELLRRLQASTPAAAPRRRARSAA